MNLYEVILRPIVTEQSMGLVGDHNKYTFEVALKANKRQVAEAVEKIFSVKVVDVHTMTIKGKQRRWGRTPYRTPARKKAIVTLAEGNTIEVFSGA